MAGFGLGGGSSKSSSSFDQSVFGGDAFKGMYGNFGNLWNQMNPFMMGGFDYLNQIDPSMQQAVQSGGQGSDYMLGGGSYGNTDDIRSKLLSSMGGRSNMGSMYESIVGGSGNTYIDPMVDAMRSSGNEALNKQLSRGDMTAGAMGQGGSSRHAMQNAMLERSGLDDMNKQETMMRGGAYDKDLMMKMDIARMADNNAQSEQDRMMSMLQGADSNVGAGMNYQPSMQNMSMGMMAPYMQAFMMPWMGAQAYSGAMGDPTVLSSGESSGKSWNASGGFGL